MDHSDFPAVVIGTSMGGLETLQSLCVQMPRDLGAAVFIVQHMAAGGPSLLPAILQRTSSLPVAVAENGGDILPGTISVAVPDLHLMIMESVTLLTRGPKENHTRPAIDVLFRSAANAFGPRTIGVVLSGMLDDGTAGLSAIKRAGGTTVVQEPKDALYPEMPTNALMYVHPDHVVPVSQMGQLLDRLVQNRMTGASKEVPEDIRRETQVMQGRAITEEVLSDWKDISLSCPDCGGPLREHTGDVIPRYRCMVGHAYSINSLIASMGTTAEKALWSAVRIMEERSKTLEKNAFMQERNGWKELVRLSRSQAEESRRSAEVIRNLLLQREGNGDPSAEKRGSPGTAD